MSNSHRYYPTREDRDLFQKLVATVRRDPTRFREAGVALDAYYSPELVRLRNRARYEAEARAFSGSISKAATHPAIGPYREPDVSLAVRFNCAWRDTFFVTENEPGLPYFVLEYKPEDRRYRTALFLLGREDQIEIAERRVLMAWLKLDAGRGKIEPRITAFQSLESSFSESGYMPISQPRDPAWRAVRDRQIGLAEEGFWGHHEARWIELAREALAFLDSQSEEAGPAAENIEAIKRERDVHVGELAREKQANREAAGLVMDRGAAVKASAGVAGGQSAKKSRLEWLAKAMLVVRDHPEWSDRKIAKDVGKSPSTLSRSKEYQQAALLARQASSRPGVKGYRVRGKDGAAGVEAIDYSD